MTLPIIPDDAAVRRLLRMRFSERELQDNQLDDAELSAHGIKGFVDQFNIGHGEASMQIGTATQLAALDVAAHMKSATNPGYVYVDVQAMTALLSAGATSAQLEATARALDQVPRAAYSPVIQLLPLL